MAPDTDDVTAWTTFAEPFLPPGDCEWVHLREHHLGDPDELTVDFDPRWGDCHGSDGAPVLVLHRRTPGESRAFREGARLALTMAQTRILAAAGEAWRESPWSDINAGLNAILTAINESEDLDSGGAADSEEERHG